MKRLPRTVRKNLFVSFCLLPLVMGCNSSLSSGPVTDPSRLRVNVVIAHTADYDGRLEETVEAFIQDEGGKAVANPQIRVKVNGHTLSLNNGSSNYYGAYPSYRLNRSTAEIGTDTTCTVTVVLTDGAEYTLGTIQTQPTLTPAHFAPPATHTRRQPLPLHWQDLEPHNWLVRYWKRWTGESSATNLSISKSNKTVDQWGYVHYTGGSTDVADYITIDAGSGSGDYTLPVSYFAEPLNQFNTLDILINSDKTLDANGPFLKGSVIRSSRRGLYRVMLTD